MNNDLIIKDDLYAVRTIALMMYLVRLNYDVVYVDDSFENPKYKIFYFKKSKYLEKDVKKYRKNHKKERYDEY